MAAKYYAVRQGRSTGVFLSWAECQKQVNGFPGAVFKSFSTIEEAEAFVKGDRSEPMSMMQEADGTMPAKAGSMAMKRTEKENTAAELLRIEPEALVAYVDGSYHSVTREFSYGMVILSWDFQGAAESEKKSEEEQDKSQQNDSPVKLKEQTYCEKFVDLDLASMRNVAGEIKGAEAAMRYAVSQGYSKLYIFHDYEGIARWCRGEWKAGKEGTKAYKAYYDSIQDRLQVIFVKVAAHTGDKYNEMADKLAKQALGIVG